MAAPRKYPEELRERAIRMAVELRRDPDTEAWHRLEWEHAPGLGAPFSQDAVDYAKCLVTGLTEALNPGKDESHGSTEEVPGRASGAGDPDGGGPAA